MKTKLWGSRKIRILAVVFLIAIFLCVSSAMAATKSLNNRGQIVWEGFDGTDWWLYSYFAGATTQIAWFSGSGNYFDVNNRGQIVWANYDDDEIYLFSNGTTAQITNTAFGEDWPLINDAGQISWVGYGAGTGLYLYSGGITSTIASQDIYWHDKNNLGQMVWSGWDGAFWEIYLYSGGITTQITNNTDNDCPVINDRGQIAWTGWDGTDWEIYLYSGGATTQITNDSFDDYCPNISNQGLFVWPGWDGNDYEIYLYSAGVTIPITNNLTDDWRPDINNRGQIAWQGFDGSDWEIYFYSNTRFWRQLLFIMGYSVNNLDFLRNLGGSITLPVTDNNYDDYWPHLNDRGQIAWMMNDGVDEDIYFYSSGTTTAITNNPYDDNLCMNCHTVLVTTP